MSTTTSRLPPGLDPLDMVAGLFIVLAMWAAIAGAPLVDRTVLRWQAGRAVEAP